MRHTVRVNSTVISGVSSVGMVRSSATVASCAAVLNGIPVPPDCFTPSSCPASSTVSLAHAQARLGAFVRLEIEVPLLAKSLSSWPAGRGPWGTEPAPR